jgi:AAA domain, putative AbiEii toxin, Type IV TA system
MMEALDDATGDADKFRFGIQTIQIGDGADRPIGGPGSVTLVVGANNVGKSTVLAQIREMLLQDKQSREADPRIVTVLSPLYEGSAEDFDAWLRAHSATHVLNGQAVAVRPNVQLESIEGLVNTRKSNSVGRLVNWLVNHQTGAGRVGGLQPGGRIENAGDPPKTELQMLHVNRGKLDELARVIKRLFGFDLLLDAVGQSYCLRMGVPDVPAYPVDSYDAAYDAAVAALPLTQAQGDGIRAALGLLVPLIANLFPLVLLDEPEAFLHPPQSWIVGKEIGKQAKDKGSQVIIATHDKNILQGVIESGVPVTILHLTRGEGDKADTDLLEADKVAELWKDPALRYTNALEGLFHSAVIVAESERDGHFYNAAIDFVRNEPEDRPAHNLMFLGSNGKTNLARIVRSLRDLGVRTVSCPDLDILNDETVLRRLVEAHGGDWADFSDDYRRATAEFRNVPSALNKADVREQIIKFIDDSTDAKLTEHLATAIATAVKIPSTRWSELKKGFLAFSDDRAAATRLLDKLDALGIVTVKVGVLENFVTTVTAPKGPEFLTVAFDEDAHIQQPAVDHAKRLLNAANIR